MERKIKTVFFVCPICGGAKFHKVYGVSIFTVALCRSCGLVCLNPRMDEREYMGKLYKNYRKDLFGGYLAHDVDSKEFYDKPVESQGAKKVFSDLKGYLPRETAILEVGCGVGEALILFKQDGFRNLMGIDPGLKEEHRKSLEELYNIECFNKSLSEFVQEIGEKKKFDCVILDQVVEHFIEPGKDFKTLYSLMADGGTLYITTPDFYKFDRPFSQFAIPHTFYFSQRTLETLLKKCGFRVERRFDTFLPTTQALLARKEETMEAVEYDRGEYDRVLTYLKKNKFLFILFKSKRFMEEVYIKVFGENAYLRARVLLKNAAVAMIKAYRRRRK